MSVLSLLMRMPNSSTSPGREGDKKYHGPLKMKTQNLLKWKLHEELGHSLALASSFLTASNRAGYGGTGLPF